MDSLPEEDYDNITRIASQICNTPISLITLIDENRQWFKSKYGLDVNQTPREFSFCAHGMLNPKQPFIVRNSLEDPRFKDNPLVTSDPHVEFYAGISLVTPEGFALGSLCVIDDHPRDISEQQVEALRALASQVVKLLELRKLNFKLKRTEAQLKASNENLNEFANLVAHDIKTPLNNMKMLSDILLADPSLQVGEDGQLCLNMLGRSAQQAVDFVNGVLSYSKSTNFLLENKEKIDLQIFLGEIIQRAGGPSHISFQLPDVSISVFTSKIALYQILSNLIGNAIKYNDKSHGVIRIEARQEQDIYYFQVQDNGRGIPTDRVKGVFNLFYRVDPQDEQSSNSSGIGLAIVKKLIEQLGGKITVSSVPGEGTSFNFHLKK